MSIANLPTGGLSFEGRVLLSGVSYATYEAIVEEIESSGTRLTYDHGYLEIVSPSRKHDRVSRLLGRMVGALTEELDIPISSGGSTTMKLALKERGVEPYECYYVANEPRMRGHDDYDPAVDPPSDLVIEVDISRNSLNKFNIYADFGVPEIWTYEDDAIRVYRLQDDGSYASQAHSRTFPFLPLESLEGFLEPQRYGRNDLDPLVSQVGEGPFAVVRRRVTCAPTKDKTQFPRASSNSATRITMIQISSLASARKLPYSMQSVVCQLVNILVDLQALVNRLEAILDLALHESSADQPPAGAGQCDGGLFQRPLQARVANPPPGHRAGPLVDVAKLAQRVLIDRRRCQRHVVGERFRIGLNFMLQLAEFALVETELGQSKKRFVHAVGRAQHHRTARPPKDAVAAHKNFDSRLRRGIVGLGHPLLALFLLVKGRG